MKVLITTIFAACTVCIKAQTELNSRFNSRNIADMSPIGVTPLLHLNPAHFKIDMNSLELKHQDQTIVNDYIHLPTFGITGKDLWTGAFVEFFGQTFQLLGLMNNETISIPLYQNIGRWHLVVSAQANKYWIPWQNELNTQFGYGVLVNYNLNPSVSLHTFGYYYANNMHVGPAMSPYVNNTNYGIYAHICFTKNFGANLGVCRYINPINGKWTTEPIVNPYVKIGDSRLEIPLGNLFKTFMLGSHDNHIQFRQTPPDK